MTNRERLILGKRTPRLRVFLPPLRLRTWRKRSKSAPFAAFFEKASRIHGCQLFGNGDCDELVHANAVTFSGFDKSFFHRSRES